MHKAQTYQMEKDAMCVSAYFGNRMFDSIYCWTCLVKQQFCKWVIFCVFHVKMMLKAAQPILKYYWLFWKNVGYREKSQV